MIPLHNELLVDHEYDVVEVDKITSELFQFLNKTFGPPGPRWWFSNNKIYFRDEKDWMWFELAT